MSARGAIAAQVAAETRTRLRSAGTVFTLLVLFAAAFAYVPPPGSKRVSIMWHVGEQSFSGTYTLGFVGAIVAMLTAMLLPLVGFYLVTGSVRRDLERRVWPIVAATPTSPVVYLLGKWLAGVGYLLVVAALGLLPAAILFVQHGTGRFDLGQLLMPWLLLVPPAMLFTAAMALLFDVTPGLRGRGGYVVWFFVWSFGFLMIPAALGNMLDQDRSNDRYAVYDPSGMAFFERMLSESVGGRIDGLSLGVILTDDPVTRVEMPPLRADLAKVGWRLSAAAWTALPLLAAAGIFRLARHRPPRERQARVRPAAVQAAAAGAPERPALTAPTPRATAPGFARSLLAETGLTWRAASLVKWPLLALALLAGVVPGDALRAVMAGFLLLLAPVIAEVAARESLAGTGPMVFAQPGTPRSVVGWKAAATLALVLLLGAPALLHSFALSSERGTALLLAFVFVATAATGLGWLTRGGKLFLGSFTALWYMAIQNESPVDFSGAFGARPDVALAGWFAAAGVVFALAAAATERFRERGA
jgi:hypothetical protein